MVRSDIGMQPGKIAAQAGHAYLEAYKTSALLPPEDPFKEHFIEYSKDLGTKICFGGNLDELQKTKHWLELNNIPHSLIVDSGHMAFFNGEPTITALGWGPCTNADVKKLTKHLKLTL